MAKIQRLSNFDIQATFGAAKLRLTSLKSWELPKQSSSLAPEYVWSNPDQDPVPIEKQTWTSWSFIGYWFSDLFTIAGWEAASSAILVGLGTPDAILIALAAVAVRASFGYWFSYFAVASRCILALFWFGLQGYGGTSAMAALLTAIWPSFGSIPNHLPEDSGTSTQMMIAYLLYNICQFPLLMIPTHKLQYMFMAKAMLVPPMVLGMVIWSCVKASGSGSTTGVFIIPTTVTGSTRAWLWLSTMTSVTGGYSTLAVNVSDFSRFSRNPGSQWWQLPIIPAFKVFTSLFGIICTGASKSIYGSYQWNPLTIVSSWGTTPGGRFAAFVCSAIWLLAQVSCNMSANAISFANDMTTMMPGWFNIRRGVIFAAVFGGYALVPWIILSSASNLLNFMSGYAIFLGPYAGILACDYWLVRRKKVDVPTLYDPHGIYRYNKYGMNWRAAVPLFLVVPPLLPGLAHACQLAVWLFYLGGLIFRPVNCFPTTSTFVPETVYGTECTPEVIEGIERQGVNIESKEKTADVPSIENILK